MNDLTARLRKLAALLEEKGAELEGKSWNTAVTGFGKALTKFEGSAEDAAKGLAPGLRDLSKLFESPDKKLLDESVMKKLYKEILAARPPKDVTTAKMRTAFLAEVKTQGGTAAKKALSLAQEVISELKAPKEKPSKDSDKLRLELHRLGMLPDDDQREFELAKRFSDKADLKRLAQAAGIPVNKDAKKPALAAAILTAAKRVAAHTVPV
jgi:hypothetical protein